MVDSHTPAASRGGVSCHRAHMLCVVLATLLLASTASGAAPSKRELARAQFTKAEAHFKRGEYQLALTSYQEARRHDPLPAFLFNIALCHRNLKRHEQALHYLRLYLAQAPEAPNRPMVEKLIKEAKEARGKVGGTEAKGPPAEPDGGQLQPPAEHPPKEVPQPKASKPLPTDPAAPIAAATKPKAKAGGPTASEGALPTASVKAAPGEARRSDPFLKPKVLLWSGVGLTAALLLTGTVTGQIASNRSAEYRDAQTPHAELSGLRDSARSHAAASIVTFAAGAAAGIGTALYYWFGYRKSTELSVSVAPSSSGGALMIRWVR